MVFAGYSGFLHYLQLASHELATIGMNVTKNEIQIQFQIVLYHVCMKTKPMSLFVLDCLICNKRKKNFFKLKILKHF